MCNLFHCLWCIDIEAMWISNISEENEHIWSVNAPQGIVDRLQKGRRSKVWRRQRMFVLSMREFAAAPVAHE